MARSAYARVRWAAVALLCGTLACGGGDSTSPPGANGAVVASVTVNPKATLTVGVGGTVRFTTDVRDTSGQRMSVSDVEWRVSSAAVATVDAQGVATSVASGTTQVTATAGGKSGSASLEVWVPAEVASYEPGQSYYGRQEYVEYIPGMLPLVISAPHGGSLEPSEIPDRTSGTTVTDSNTRETVLAVRQAFIDRTGQAPHVIISHLRRTKLDPNREIVEAAQGNPFAENAWGEFQGFIELASDAVAAEYGSGFYIDLHGHGHAIARAELGYLLSAGQLNGSDASLDSGNLGDMSSVRALAQASPLPFSGLLRGGTSLGALMQQRGVRAVPSPEEPSPGEDAYFSGGYNTARHGSQAGGSVSGVQIELPRPGIRDTEANRAAFGAALAAALEAYMTEHFGFFLTPPGPGG